MQNEIENRMKFYDMKEGLIRQIPVVFNDIKERSILMNFLKEHGYHGDVETGERKVLYLDNRDKTYHEPSITIMACWCSGRRHPLNVKEFIDNYHWLIEEPDIERYHKLIEQKCNEKPERKQNAIYRAANLNDLPDSSLT